ncbi:MAG: LysM peptidoglycan-binding domain-containing protein [Bacteroidales bacterium]|nr:LysM peptidoglycan-binding domain-containing protein [Bacteroidales bacterium]
MKKLASILIAVIVGMFSQLSFSQSESMKTFFQSWQSNLNNAEIIKIKSNTEEYKFVEQVNNVSFVNLGNEKYEINDDAEWMYQKLLALPNSTKNSILNEIKKIDQEINLSNKKINLPFSIGSLAMATSAFNSKFTDNSYSYGYFALPYFVAISAGLRIDSVYDERLNISKSASAASMYLNDLHESFETWNLAVFAYANSPSKLNQLKENKEISIIELSVFDALLACMMFENANQTHLLQDNIHEYSCDTVLISKKLHLGQISEFLSIPIANLKDENPEIIGNVIYGNLKPYKFRIHQDFSEKLAFSIDSIANYKDTIFFPPVVEKATPKNIGKPVFDYGKDYDKISYTIKSGDNLGSIAQKFNVKISDIQDWNDVYGTKIIAGKTLIIYQKKNSSAPKKIKTTSAPKPIIPRNLVLIDTYEVKKGDSPYSISSNYQGVSPEDIMEWNGIENPSKIQIGQKLKIYGKK